jgi:hypothetical protein
MAKLLIKKIFFKSCKVILCAFCILFFIILSLIIIINLPSVQDKIAKQALSYLNKEFKTNISAQRIEVDYFGNLTLHEVIIKDHHQNDLLTVKELKGYLNTISLVENLLIKHVDDIKIDQLRLLNPIIKVITYKNEERDNFSIFIDNFNSDKPSQKKDFKLKGRVDIINGQFSIVNQNLPPEDQVWLDTSELNLKASKVDIFNSDVKVKVEQFNFKAKRNKENYIVHHFSSHIHYSETELSFKDLIFESDTSLLLGSLFFNYTKENGMSNFVDQVIWTMDVNKGSKVSGKDIRYFVKSWNTNSIFSISSKVNGTLNNLILTQPVLSVNGTFYSSPKLELKNLVTSDASRFFNLNAKEVHLQSSYASLQSWLPKFISTDIPEIVSEFGTLNYIGSFLIDKKNLILNGKMISSLGTVTADAQLNDYTSKKPKYKGTLETYHLNLASFIKSTTLGPITAKIQFDGSGFDLNHMDTKFDAKLNSLDINGKSINDISAIGNLRDKIFEGKIVSNDSYANFNFNGSIDFSQKNIKTSFDADIQSLNLGYFTSQVDKNKLFKGLVKADIQFNSIDDLIGEITINSISLEDNGKLTKYNDIQIKTNFEQGNRNLDIFSPNMITANIYGKYKLKDIPDMLQKGMGNLVSNFKTKKRFDNQEFSFILDLQKDLFDLLMMDVNLSPGTTITGRYIGNGNKLQAQMISEYIYYKNIKLTNPNIFLNTEDSLRQFIGSLSTLSIDNKVIDRINFSGFNRNDSLFASTNFYYGKYKEKQTNFDLNLYQTQKNNDLIIGFKPSHINLAQARWKLNPNFNSDEAIAKYNLLTNKLVLQKIELTSENSEILLSGEYTTKNEYTFDLNLKDVKLEKILPHSLLKDMSFEGIANGSAKVLKNSSELRPLIDLYIDQLKFNGQNLGNLAMRAIYDAKTNRYLLQSKLEDSGQDRFLADGYIVNKEGKSSQLNIDLIANQMNIAPIGTFLQSIFSNFRGTATGNVQITGDVNSPKYQGSLTMSKVGFKVNFLGVDYQLTKDQDLQISDGVFLFDNIELMDTQRKTKGVVFGPLMTKNFSEWGMNLDFTSDKLLVLNTTIKENDLFYGTIYASGNFSITGTTDKGIDISAKAMALEGSSLTINSSSTTNATDIQYIKFIPEQHKDEDESESKPPTGLSIRADITADNKSVVNLIISQETGDKIVVRGDTKHLKFDMSKAGVINMDGTYTITGDSKYYYNMFVNKDFTIIPGSTIRWENRGPTEADLNIRASYTRLVSNIGDYLGISTVPATNVTVSALLTGYLSKPSLTFDIQADASSSVRDQLNTKLNNNEGEKYNQVAGIVVFGSFLSDKMGGSSYASSAYDVVLKQLTSAINNISGVFSLDANFNAGSRVDETSDRISLDPTFKVNQRLSIVGSVNMPLEQKSAADVWTYGAKINYDISKNNDKSLIINGFSKPSTFGLETSVLSTTGANNQSYGGGIVYKRSFNKFSEFFGKRKKKVNPKEKKDSINIKK